MIEPRQRHVLLSQQEADAVLSFCSVPATGGITSGVVAAFPRAWLIGGLPLDMALCRAMLEANGAGAPLYTWGGFELFG